MVQRYEKARKVQNKKQIFLIFTFERSIFDDSQRYEKVRSASIFDDSQRHEKPPADSNVGGGAYR